MARPVKTLREAVHDLTLMSDDGSEYEHNDGCQGEAECPACWVEGIRRLFADFPDEAPIFSQTRVAEALAGHDVRYIIQDGRPRWFCPCGDWETDEVMVVVAGHASHLAALVMAVGMFRDEATVKAEALEEAVASGEFPGLTMAREWIAARAVSLRAGDLS